MHSKLFELGLCLSLLFLFSYSCDYHLDRQLTAFETGLNNNPDSILASINQINVQELKGRSRKARYALIKSMALDKAYYDETNDSLINIAVDYYSLRNDSKRKMQAWYYQGLVRNNAGDLSAAIVSLEQAEKEAIMINDNHYLGLIYRNIGGIFNQSNNLTSTVSYLRKAVAAFEKNNEDEYVNYAKYSLGIALTNNKEYEEARSVFHELLSCDIDSVLHYRVLPCLAETYVCLGDSIARAIQIYKQLPPNYMYYLDYSYYAFALALSGEMTSALAMSDIGYQLAQSIEDRNVINYMTARIDSLNGDYYRAYQKVRRASYVQDSLTRVLLRQSTTAAQRDYFKNEMILRENKVKRQKSFILFGTIITILLLSLGIMYAKRQKQIQESLQKEQMAQLSLYKTTQKNNSNLIGALFFEKITHLCSISGAYYSSDAVSVKEKYYNEYKNSLRELQHSEKVFKGLESDLNQYCSNIMVKLRNQIPSMTERHCRFTSLFFADVPNEAIQVIMSCNSLASVRTMRSRIRSEIKEASPKDESLFLEMLASEKQPRKQTKE